MEDLFVKLMKNDRATIDHARWVANPDTERQTNRMVRFGSMSFALAWLLASCATPGVSRKQAIETAWTYSKIEWKPVATHAMHGKDADGIEVQTPDAGLQRHGYQGGWWQANRMARGMPYQWGGFDTPESFASSLARGEVAGDISTPAKRKLGDAAVSRHSAGIDCSGFVSRCWNLSRPYSTKQLPEICTPLKFWFQLQPGDILLNDRHVLLFAGWQTPGKVVLAYEAGPFPVWRVNSAAIPCAKLEREGYAPWRYRKIRD